MEQFQQILALEFLQNTVRDYLVCALTLLIGLLIIKILQDIIFARLKKIVDRTDTQLDGKYRHQNYPTAQLERRTTDFFQYRPDFVAGAKLQAHVPAARRL